jgi:predicted dehydrogenase
MAIRVGLAGCGWMAPFHLQGWRSLPDIELAGLCDREEARARELTSRFDVPWAGGDAIRMMDECRLDVLDVAATPEAHKELTLAALDRGIHVVCQKPLAPALADAREMVRRAEQRGRALYVNEMLRFCPWYVRVKALLEAGAIGRLGFARIFCRTAAMMEVGPDRLVQYGFRHFLKSQERLIVIEETIHYLDVARYLFGDPLSLYAATGRLSPAVKGEDSVAIMLQYGDLTVLVDNSWSAHGPPRSGLEIEGDSGALLLSHGKVLELHSGRTGSLESRWDFDGRPWDELRADLFAALFRDFLGVIRKGQDLTAQARDNLKTLRLVLAAYESAAGGVAVAL